MAFLIKVSPMIDILKSNLKNILPFSVSMGNPKFNANIQYTKRQSYITALLTTKGGENHMDTFFCTRAYMSRPSTKSLSDHITLI